MTALPLSILCVNQEGSLEADLWLSSLKYICLSKSLLVSFTSQCLNMKLQRALRLVSGVSNANQT